MRQLAVLGRAAPPPARSPGSGAGSVASRCEISTCVRGRRPGGVGDAAAELIGLEPEAEADQAQALLAMLDPSRS